LRLLKILPATVWTRVRRVPSDAVARSYSFEHADTSGTAAEIEVQRLKSLQSTSVWLMVRPY
jgi:hypothetical protein